VNQARFHSKNPLHHLLELRLYSKAAAKVKIIFNNPNFISIFLKFFLFVENLIKYIIYLKASSPLLCSVFQSLSELLL
ncbi:hypothetical protein, partial [Maribellus sediminis]|uniref:hypothetical protein n=1 Tax=Maribellus sediminis TaxID=2696285 RepID=UPI00197F4C7B